MQRINTLLFTLLQLVLFIDNTKQSRVKQAITTIKAIGKTIKSPITKTFSNTMKNSVSMLRRNKNSIKNIACGFQEKYLKTSHNFGNKSVKFLGAEAFKNFKRTVPQATIAPGKKNIQMRTAAQMGGKELRTVVKRSSGQIWEKELGSLLNMVSKSKPQLPFLVGGGLYSLNERSLIGGFNPFRKKNKLPPAGPEDPSDQQDVMDNADASKAAFHKRSQEAEDQEKKVNERQKVLQNKPQKEIEIITQERIADHIKEINLENELKGEKNTSNFMPKTPSMKKVKEELNNVPDLDKMDKELGKMGGDTVPEKQDHGELNSDGDVEGFDKDGLPTPKFNKPGELSPKDLPFPDPFRGLKEFTKTTLFGGHTYEGQLVDERMHGIGRITYKNGAVFEGDFRDKKMEGKGKIVLPSGDIYEGDFHDNMQHGEGKLISSEGNVYEGGFVENVPQGKGKIVYANGEHYEGDFFAGQLQGIGKLKTANGNTFEGDIFEGQMHGRGRLTYENGEMYEGDFVNGQMAGKGKFTYLDGTIYEGAFGDEKANGQGHLKQKDGTNYKGTFFYGIFGGGKGTLNYANGDKYTGDIHDGLMQGTGTFTYNDGSIYIGEFEYGKAANEGMITYANGEFYKGQFKDSMFDGEGRFVFLDDSTYTGHYVEDKRCGYGEYKWTNGSFYKGYWKDNKYNGEGEQYQRNLNQLKKCVWKDGEPCKEGEHVENYERPFNGNPEDLNPIKKTKFHQVIPPVKNENRRKDKA